MLATQNPTQTKAWAALETHFAKVGKRSMCLAIMACAVCRKKVLMRNLLNVLVVI